MNKLDLSNKTAKQLRLKLAVEELNSIAQDTNSANSKKLVKKYLINRMKAVADSTGANNEMSSEDRKAAAVKLKDFIANVTTKAFKSNSAINKILKNSNMSE